MKLYCKCLNICIEIWGDIGSDTLKSMYPFNEILGEEAAEVEAVKISHRLPNLIKEKTNEQWRIYVCINCGMYSYASKKESNYPLIVNRSLLSNPTVISDLSISENFSPAFKIVLKPDDSNTDDLYDQKLNETASLWLKEEEQRTEERIKNYTEQQYSALESHRLRALKDNLIINRVISADCERQTVKSNVKSHEARNNSPTKAMKNKSNENVINDVGEAIMFPLDDFDHPLFAKDYTDGADVTEDEDDNPRVVHYRKTSTAHFARSLPIPVPQYMHDLAYDAKSNGSPPVPTDIAASIRALAKSVHGDSVFGELPRPRFRNYL